MMCSFAMSVLLSVFVQAHANEVSVNNRDNLSEHLVNALVEKLFDRVSKVSNIDNEDLENAVLGKSSALATPTSRLTLPAALPSPLSRRSVLPPRSLATQAARSAPDAPFLEISTAGATLPRRATGMAVAGALMSLLPSAAKAGKSAYSPAPTTTSPPPTGRNAYSKSFLAKPYGDDAFAKLQAKGGIMKVDSGPCGKGFTLDANNYCQPVGGSAAPAKKK